MNKERKTVVGIIGLGYVGMPLAYLTASKGYEVIGIDKDEKKVESLNNRVDIPKPLEKQFNTEKKYCLNAYSTYKRLSQANIIIICVPTPTINNEPDLSIISDVISELSIVLSKGTLIIVESTVAPGMTKKYVSDKLYECNKLRINSDYQLAYCPERIDPGNSLYWVGNINRVCGAASNEALNRTIDFYKSIITGKVLKMKSIEEAELIKVWENSIRNISIAESNLLAKICDKYDFSVKEVLMGLNSKIEQFPLSLSYPGIGPGGHCIPEDIHYMIQSLEDNNYINMELFKESIKINENMPKYAFDKLMNEINNDKMDISKLKFLMLGISYKPNTNDTRRSQAKVLLNIFKNNGINISYYDYICNHSNFDKIEEEIDDILKDNDVIIVGCAHNQFKIIDYKKYHNIKYILDCWNVYDRNEIEKNNIKYIGIGE